MDQFPRGLLPRRSGVEERVEQFLQSADDRHVADKLRPEVERVLRILYEGEPDDPVPLNGPVAEMIVIADGARPIFFFKNGAVEKGAGTGPSVDLLVRNAGTVAQASQAVGRIESDVRVAPDWTDRWFAGTGLLIASDLLMTNRHVMEALVNEPTSGVGPFTLNGPYWLNLDGEFGVSSRRRIKIAGVAWAGPAFVGPSVNLTKLDMAVLRLGAVESADVQLPQPLLLALDPPALGEPVYVTGYTDRPKIAGGSVPGPDTEVEEVLIRLFDQRCGGKRCGSEEIDARPGFPGDAQTWALKHDVSTLGGNSGSPLISLSSGTPRIVGLHFGGESRVTNFAHLPAQSRRAGTPWRFAYLARSGVENLDQRNFSLHNRE